MTDVAFPPRALAGASAHGLPSRAIVGMRVDATSYDDASRRIVDWAAAGESRYVCVATVNNVMEAHDDPSFLQDMNGADLVTPDGMPLVWGLKMLGVGDASRVYGPTLTPRVIARAAAAGVPIGFYGGTPEVLDDLERWARTTWPRLEIAFRASPPFRTLTPQEEAETLREIASSGARILFVGLGCPKQERWMARHAGRVPAVSVGVGAAFDFLTGRKRQAPPVLQRLGLEWMFRLVTEPRRLWKRYLRHNPRFVALFSAQLVRERLVRRSGIPT